MGRKKDYSHPGLSFPQNHQQIFSEELKRKKVKEIERGLVGVTELSRVMNVSRSAIYKWIKKYSLTYEKRVNIIVESKSETRKLKVLQEELKEVHALLGQKQIEVEFYKKMVEIAGKELGFDLKKKYGTKL